MFYLWECTVYVVMHTDSRLSYVMGVSLVDVRGGNADSATLNHPD